MSLFPNEKFMTFLHQHELLGPDECAIFWTLTGGVSSEIWCVKGDAGTICVKAALEKLNVEREWYAPIERNAYEVAWMRKANALVPGTAPVILADDPENGLFAMTYLDSDEFPNWKINLKEGHIDPDVARSVGTSLSFIHRQTMGDKKTEAQFRTDKIFHAIRLEPYLEATAEAHPDLSSRLMTLSQTTAHTKQALVHGDVSPKNILVGAEGPKFIDAECAWYGDPAFDLAFCLNHFLLKCLWKPAFTEGYLACFDAMVAGYQGAMNDNCNDIENRAAGLLPGLMLGRVDGRSPVEYLTTDSAKNHVRRISTELLKAPPTQLGIIRQCWHASLNI